MSFIVEVRQIFVQVFFSKCFHSKNTAMTKFHIRCGNLSLGRCQKIQRNTFCFFFLVFWNYVYSYTPRDASNETCRCTHMWVFLWSFFYVCLYMYVWYGIKANRFRTDKVPYIHDDTLVHHNFVLNVFIHVITSIVTTHVKHC